MTASHRHRRGGLPIAKTVVIVLAIHALAGGGLLFLAKTQTGQEIARTYHIKLFQPDKPPPPKPKVAKQEPPPPKVPQVRAKVPEAAPQVAAAAPPPEPQIGGAGGGAVGSGVNWSGGIFAGGFDGPDGAFHAAITARFRKHYQEPKDSFGAAQLKLVVTGSGQVSSYRLVHSSGDPANDRAILAAAQQVKSEGVPAPPKNEGRVVTVRFVPY